MLVSTVPPAEQLWMKLTSFMLVNSRAAMEETDLIYVGEQQSSYGRNYLIAKLTSSMLESSRAAMEETDLIYVGE